MFSLRSAKRAPNPLMSRFGLPQYTSVGCYTILYLDKHSEPLCVACATWERFKGPIVSGAFWEGDSLQCAECNGDIESSYGPVED